MQFHKTLILGEEKELSWEGVQERCSYFLKGWWELSKLKPSVKLEFLRDYWFNAIPYTPQFYAFIDRLFALVQKIDVMLIKNTPRSPYVPFLAYHTQDSFYLGGHPMKEHEIERFKQSTTFPIPEDFLSFLRIHNGIACGNDAGVFPVEIMQEYREHFLAEAENREIRFGKKIIDPQSLFPFYLSPNLDAYQCFYKEWYADGVVGNVLCALSEGNISIQKEKLGFQTFLDWLVFYMDPIMER